MANKLDVQLSAFATRVAQEIAMLHLRTGILANLSTEEKRSLVGAINEVITIIESVKETIAADEANVEKVKSDVDDAIAKVEDELAKMQDQFNDVVNPIDDKLVSSSTTYSSYKIEELVTELKGLISAIIDDTEAATDKTYSSSKIEDVVQEAANQVKDDLLGGAGEAYDTLKELADLIKDNEDAIDALKSLAAGHVKFDEAQDLTDVQKAQARENIGAASSTELALVQATADKAQSTADAAQSDVDSLRETVESLSDTMGEPSDYVALFEETLAS